MRISTSYRYPLSYIFLIWKKQTYFSLLHILTLKGLTNIVEKTKGSFGCDFKMIKSTFRENVFGFQKHLKCFQQEAPVMCFF